MPASYRAIKDVLPVVARTLAATIGASPPPIAPGAWRCSTSRPLGRSSVPAITRDQLIGHVVQVAADDQRLRTDPQD
jgi:hypothetical protein